jgi:ABC-2 type transport system permease protein
MAVWHAAAASAIEPGRIQGRTAGEISGYFLMTMIVGHLCTAWDVFEMGWLVRTGRLSPKLLRPILPVWESLTDNIAYKIVTLLMLVPMWVIVALVARPTIDVRAFDIALALVAVPLAAAVIFIWNHVAATFAFFVTKMDATAEMFFGLGFFFGGRMAPIELLPPQMQTISAALPFRWVIAYPSQLLAGQLAHDAALRGLAWQAGWLIGGILAFRFCWSRGVRRYSAVGA